MSYDAPMNIELHPDLKGRVLAAWGLLKGLGHEEDPGFRDHLETVCADFARRYEGMPPSEIEQLAPARELYRSVGMDPTRHRPSSEALLRRAIQGKGLYRLDPIVDTGNLFSMSAGLPLGLYDASRIRGDVVLRLGEEGEGFEGIRKGRVNVSGRLCLSDGEGAFGSPTSDSDRCRIRQETADILYLLYAPASLDSAWLREQGEALADSFLRWNGGKKADSGELA